MALASRRNLVQLGFLSAMLALQKRAQSVGADAVVNIVSNYKNIENSSATEFECHEGTMRRAWP